ncbi:MAG: trypsin-like peptidase domain-containing protein [Bacilli bacterium]|nr:trypsin-like peptidase domain-containing protein [Bacilli bacterium]
MDKDLFNSDDYKINDDLTNGENNDVVVNNGNVSKDMINVSESKKNVVNSGLKKENKSVKKNEMNVKNNNTSIVLIMSILLSFVCGMLGAYLMCKNVTVEQVVKNITTSELVENSISSSVDKVYDSTVVVIAYANGKQISTGTGFIYKIDGGKAYILTNNHVINDADNVEIEFNDNNDRVSGTIIGGDTYADIAVLTIDNNDYVAVEFGDVSTLKLGDTIFTVGSPMGVNYKGTVTKGILSGKERMVEVNLSGNTADYYMKVLQLDAAVNPGNSGGPLCDVSGKVIGIISLKIVQDEVEGMGFAIPIEDALKYANLIEEGGEVSRPYIGISMLDLTEEYYLWQNKITIPEGVEEGIAIISVEDDSPAKKAGLKKGDIITKINDQDTGSLAEFRYELYKYQVGEKIEVTFYRDGKVNSVNVTLGKNKG